MRRILKYSSSRIGATGARWTSGAAAGLVAAAGTLGGVPLPAQAMLDRPRINSQRREYMSTPLRVGQLDIYLKAGTRVKARRLG
jgi:hypothetical protein